ncbi:hypothetical protein SLS54_001721 [Diplodia seriata]
MNPISTTVAEEETGEKFNYDGYRVLRVAYSEYQKNPEAVAALGQQLSDEPAQFGQVDLLVAPEKNADVDGLGIDFQVIQDDLGAAIKQEEDETVEYLGEFFLFWNPVTRFTSFPFPRVKTDVSCFGVKISAISSNASDI